MKIPLLEWLECNKGNALVQSIGEWPGMKVAVLLRGQACLDQATRIRGAGVCSQGCLFNFKRHSILYNVPHYLTREGHYSSEAQTADTREPDPGVFISKGCLFFFKFHSG